MTLSNLISRVLVVLGVCVCGLASLTLMVTIRNFVRMVRFGGPTGGYIGASNFGYMVFDGGVTLVLLLIGGLLLRPYIGSPKGQMTAYVVAVVVVILGINAGLM